MPTKDSCVGLMIKLVPFTCYMKRLQMAIPDPKSVIQLPWKKDVAWVASDLYMNGSLLEQSPRQILKNQVHFSSIAFAICTSLQVADNLVLHIIYYCFAKVPKYWYHFHIKCIYHVYVVCVLDLLLFQVAMFFFF